eukprot:jgi/Mesvir1/28460/Mv15883-RA.1
MGPVDVVFSGILAIILFAGLSGAQLEVSTEADLRTSIQDPAITSIILTQSLTLANGAFPDISRELNITGNCTANNQSRCVIDAGRRSRIFSVNSTGVLYLTSLNIIRGLQTEGGAILNKGRLTAEGCNFANNSASPGNGGAIHNTGRLVLVSCTFVSNWVGDKSTGSPRNDNGLGGDVYSTGAAASVTSLGCTHNDSFAGQSGACIYMSGGVHTIQGGSFFRGLTIRGGAFSVLGGATVSVSDCTFGNQLVPDRGGVAYVESSSITFNRIISNRPRANTIAGFVLGQSSQISLFNSEVNDAGGSVQGGVFYLTMVTLNIDNCTFRRAFVTNVGGALRSVAPNGFQNKISISNSVFDACRANAAGGVFLLANANATFTNTTFSRSSADLYGGAAFAQNGGGSTILLPSFFFFINCSFLHNVAGASGGGLFIDSCPVWVFGCLFQNNTGGSNAGAMDAAISPQTVVEDSQFYDNRGAIGGALSLRFSTKAFVRRSTFRNNQATGTGGTIDITNGNVVNIEDTSITDSFSATSGGAIAVDSSSLFLRNVHISRSRATIAGGAIRAKNAEKFYAMNLVGCLIENVTAEGGAALVLEGNSMIRVNDSVFDKMAATNGNGAFARISSGQLLLFDTTVKDARSTLPGGAIFVEGDSSSAYLKRSRILDAHTATGSGGAIMLTQGQVVLEDSTIDVASSVLYGGAIAAETQTNLLLVNSIISRGSAAADGGAIYSLSRLNLIGSIIADSIAGRDDGGIFVSLPCPPQDNYTLPDADPLPRDLRAVDIVNTTFRGNVAGYTESTGDGGGAYIDMDGRGVVKCIVNPLLATRPYCGQVSRWYVQKRNESTGTCMNRPIALTLDSCTFAANSATNGAGLWVKCQPGHCPELIAPTFEGNAAIGGGGGGYFMDDLPSLTCEPGGTPLTPREIVTSGCLTWEGNMALATNLSTGFGPLAASIPFRLQSSNASYNNYNSRENFQNLAVYVLDLYNQTISGGSPASGMVITMRTENVTEEDNVKEVANVTRGIGGQARVAAINGVAAFNAANLAALEGTYILEFVAPLTYSIPSTFISVQVRACVLGEVQDQEGFFCQKCAYPLFSWNPRNHSCDLCLPNSICWGNSSKRVDDDSDKWPGYVVTPKENYWHSAVYSPEFHLCRNLEACTFPGRELLLQQLMENGTYYPDAQCSKGYKGIMCAECAKGYGRDPSGGSQICTKCRSRAVNTILYLLLVLANILFMLLLVYSALRSSDNPINRPFVELVKICVTYMQFLNITATLRLDWPDGLEGFMVALGEVVSVGGNWISLDCTLDKDWLRLSLQVPLYFALAPIAMVFLVSSIWTCRYLFLKAWRATHEKFWSYIIHRVIVTIFVVLFFIWPTVTQHILTLISCSEVDKRGAEGPYSEYRAAASLYWQKDAGVRCFTGDHLVVTLAVGVPGIILFALGVPVASFLFLRHNRAHLETADFKRKYGFLYIGYSPRFYFWESVLMVQKLIVVAVAVFIGIYGVHEQILAALGVLIVWMILFLMVRPYRNERVNELGRLQWYGNTAVLLVGMWFFTGALSPKMRNLFSFFFMIVQVYFLCYFVFAILREIWHVSSFLLLQSEANIRRVGDEARLSSRGKRDRAAMRAVLRLIRKEFGWFLYLIALVAYAAYSLYARLVQCLLPKRYVPNFYDFMSNAAQNLSKGRNAESLAHVKFKPTLSLLREINNPEPYTPEAHGAPQVRESTRATPSPTPRSDLMADGSDANDYAHRSNDTRDGDGLPIGSGRLNGGRVPLSPSTVQLAETGHTNGEEVRDFQKVTHPVSNKSSDVDG